MYYPISIHGDVKDSSVEPRHFSLKELCFTSQTCDNHPTTFTQVSNLLFLAQFLDMIRDELKYAIFVNSAFRTPDVNYRVGGVSSSLHLQGLAADIWTAPHKTDELIEILRKHRTELREFIVNTDKQYIHIAL